MRERMLTLLLALGAAALFYVMFLQSGTSHDPGREVARPLSTERRGNGYYAAAEWLARAGVRTRSLRSRLTALPGLTAEAPIGNLLVITLPAVTGFRTEELVPLDRWIRRGNTLLVVASLEDRPDWAFSGGGPPGADLKVLTGLDFEPLAEPARRGESELDQATRLLKAFGEPQKASLVPNATPAMPADHSGAPRPGHALLRGVGSATALSDYPARPWTVRLPYEGFLFCLAHAADTRREVLWERPFGAGRIVVTGFGSLFTNRAIGQADNAQLLANLVAASLGPGGAVLFDDFRQGLAAAYDPAKFYRDPRLYLTLGVLTALWLAWVLGSTRLRMPRRRPGVPRELEFLRVSGGFLARVLRSDAAARRLFELFARRLTERCGRPPADGMPWDWLAQQPRVAAEELAQLRRWYAAAQASRRVPLAKLQNLLVDMDRHIA